MSNPDNTISVDVTFPKYDGPSTWLLSGAIEIPPKSAVKVDDVGKAVVGTVCSGCQFNGNKCIPSHRDAPYIRTVAIENLQDGMFGLVPENIPQGCILMGNAYTYRCNPNDPSQFELVPATDASQNVQATV